MRIEQGNNVYKATKQEEPQHRSGQEIVKGIQSNFDQFDNNPRNVSYDDIVSHFTSPPSKPPLPEIIGKANEPDIPEEALDRLRQQVAASADQNKSEKKD